jgi:hypothetical protein
VLFTNSWNYIPLAGTNETVSLTANGQWVQVNGSTYAFQNALITWTNFGGVVGGTYINVADLGSSQFAHCMIGAGQTGYYLLYSNTIGSALRFVLLPSPLGEQ